ncbi:MAG TPA: hypothetical protein VFD95_09740 [Usitatibacter sp.]|jgi:hypothetical protein|nr:hypothetical protein [Usitatibacter sp.]
MKAFPISILAAAAMSFAAPALAWTVWPDVDFEWYANVGKQAASKAQPEPATRAGYIWSPGHYEWNGSRQVSIPGVWIEDDYDRQWRAYAAGGTLALRDRDGNVIPTDAASYPIVR